ncbi:MAG: Smr/MutS family protein, partial [Planctomycetota bacterium]
GDEPLSRPFEALRGLKGRLPSRRAREAPAPEEAGQPADARPAGEPDVDFAGAMEADGVQRLGDAPGRRRRQPSRSGPRREVAPRRPLAITDAAEAEADGHGPALDLHGYRVQDVVAVLQSFVEEHRAAGNLRLRVVTGVGRHSGDGRSAVGEAAEDWLRRSAGVARLRRAASGGLLLVELRGPGRH